MKMSAETKDLFLALVHAQAELKNPHKTASNPHFKSGFAPLDEICDQIKPILLKYGLGVIQDITGNENATSVSTMIIHLTGQWIQQEGLIIPLVKKDAHGACGAVSYARRYALLAMLNIAGTDDDGNSAVELPVEHKRQKGNFTLLEVAFTSCPTKHAVEELVRQSTLRDWTLEESAKIEILRREAIERLSNVNDI